MIDKFKLSSEFMDISTRFKLRGMLDIDLYVSPETIPGTPTNII